MHMQCNTLQYNEQTLLRREIKCNEEAVTIKHRTGIYSSDFKSLKYDVLKRSAQWLHKGYMAGLVICRAARMCHEVRNCIGFS